MGNRNSSLVLLRVFLKQKNKKPSNRIMKMNIGDLIEMNKEEGTTFNVKPKRIIPRFGDNENVGGIPSEFSPW